MDYECIVLADNLGALVELCGISILERLLRTLQRCGITRVTVLAGPTVPVAKHLAPPSWARDQLQIAVREQSNEMIAVEKLSDLVSASAKFFLIVRGDSVFDARLLSRLVEQASATALMDSGKFCGAALLSRDWITTQNGLLEKAIGE